MALYILPASEQSGPVPIAYPDCAGDVVVNRYEIDLAVLPLKGKTLALNEFRLERIFQSIKLQSR